MKQKKGDEVIFDENDREKFLLGFHKRKQQKKIDYLTKKALRDKKNRVLEKMARKRNLMRRERELGLLKPEGSQSVVTSQHDMQDKFSKDMFGTDQVTVTVEYEGDDPEASQEPEEEQQAEQPVVDDETLLNDDESNLDEKEEELAEEEKAILDSVSLSEKELRKIREQANSKSKKSRKSRHKKHH